MEPKELSPEELVLSYADEAVPNPKKATKEPPVLPGQTRGIEAIEFGLSVKKDWFNISVAGPRGSGKTTLVLQTVTKKAEMEPTAQDICIHRNFTNPNKPQVLFLQAGEGRRLNRFIDEMLDLLDKQIPRLLEQPAIKAQIQAMVDGYEKKERELSASVEKFAEEKQIVLQTTPQGVNMIPLANGKPMREEDFLSLGMEEREEIDARRGEVLDKLGEVNPQILALEKEKREATDSLIKQLVRNEVEQDSENMRKLIPEPSEPLVAFLDQLKEELVAKRFLFLGDSMGVLPFGGQQLQQLRQQFAIHCRLNVVVDHSGQPHAPVVMENNPTYSNLIGGVDFQEEQGVLKADFTQVRAGSLLQASGGYLILQASDLVQQPLAYYALKRAVRTGEVKLRDQFSEMGWRSATHLEPAPIPFHTKIVLVGDEWLIQTLLNMDEEFSRLFKVHADFSRNLERTPEVTAQYAHYLRYQAEKQDLLPLEPGALARTMEEASRSVSHQNRLSAQVHELMDILIEADMMGREHGKFKITRAMVDEALALKKYRHSKIEELVKREISEGTILLDFSGKQVGQVNGLAVYQVGRVSFGVPTRITAQAYAGRAGLINIEREADLSGRLHTKGVLILNGYLGKLFARKAPLSLSVSICFEQNYGGIDGDSATAAEFFVTVSAIAQIPLRQNIAVTGSMNQHGQIQPIGGVNEKVAGFYQFAKEHNFPEGCGVMVPAVNKVNLMLDAEIVEAVREGKFHIYPVERIEEGLELMTGLSVGELGADDTYPPDSVFGIAMAKLEAFSQNAQEKKKTNEEPSPHPRGENKEPETSEGSKQLTGNHDL